MTDSLATLWTQQQHDAAPLDAEALARADARFRRRIRIRDSVEYLAGLLGAGIFANIAVHAADWEIRIACAAIILGTVVVMRNLWRRRPKAPDAALGAASHAFHRANLVAQRDLLLSVWRWYLAPIVPGMVLFLLAAARASAEHMPLAVALAASGVAGTLVGAMFWGIHWLNRAAARRLDVAIAALDRDAQ
ncbi:hypothetical protein E5A73_17110 [Sphingomonas gei]|uniref:Uncharacterized protein n=1 Tax=Sphingomonas gei TaxID=1395960 RepID=A0A4V3QYF3_9SPHN|nr:hypothetical protein [Sphingomonas gei]TGX50142.1 hypothetical protein E5A73_17110 [Sphingomonas gei]